ncbi:hypothetical protein PIB30_058796 [Stylosanthes scabra]|uniref:Uncharacterized protein n=1 Tax=Stylosanthes scabra TaxID=79078 RepID=A0ABU6XI00_9FABA|nr:hypothetical protein [Stylosanthes scabra]
MCCFMGTPHESLDNADLCNYNKLNINSSRTPKYPSSPATPPCSAAWFKKSCMAASEHVSAELLPRVRGHGHRNRSRRHNSNRHHYHRQSQSADFSYDPSSYALNFENEDSGEFPLRNFSARLPASPPPRTTSMPMKYPDELVVSTAGPKEIVGYS